MLNDLLNFSFQMAAVTVIFFIVGMINPKWPLFFLKAPTRFTIMMITPLLIMITVTMYGEGSKREREEKELAENPVKVVAPTPEPVPVPVPVPAAEVPSVEPTQ